MVNDPEKLRELLHKKGYRLTPQRQMILDVIRESRGHITLDEIYTRVQPRIPGISRATLYRTLDFLCELRLAVAADIGGGHWVYELAGDAPHHHLVCRRCGRVEKLSHAEVEQFFTRVAADHGYTIDMDHLALFGVCSQCRGNQA